MTIWLWIGFIALILGMLALDLGVFHRKAHIPTVREAVAWVVVWVGLALLFGAGVYFAYDGRWFGLGHAVGAPSNGKEAAFQYLAGYIIEESLSLDNIFVMAVIFAYFQVPPSFQHRVLFWGILGMLVMRGAMILAGVALIRRFQWVLYVLGGLLIASAVKMLLSKDHKVEPDRNPLVRLARWLYPVSGHFEGQKFFTRLEGKQAVTPLFLVLLVVESTDLLFAIDSIPAVFAITQDPLIVFTSNVFAVLGLRSLYFALAAVIEKFRYLKGSLVFVLGFVGIKMVGHDFIHIPTWASLCVVAGILLAGVAFSIAAARRGQRDH